MRLTYSTKVQNIIETMTAAQRKQMLRDVIQNMVERGDVEEMARFAVNQLGGDAMQVATAYASKD